MPHVTPFGLLGGALRGSLPNPSLLLDEAGLAIAHQVFGPRRLRPFDPRAGANITITPDALGVLIAGTGGGAAVDDAPTIDAHRAFLPHLPSRPRELKAGSNITITRDALYDLIASTAGSGSSSGGLGPLTLVESHDFGSDTTSYTFSGLNGDVDGIYLIAYQIIIKANAEVLLRPNGLTTNQKTRIDLFGDGSATPSYANLTIGSGNATGASGDTYAGQGWFIAKSGTIRTWRNEQTFYRASDGLVFGLDMVGEWSDTATNITSFDVLANVASGIGAGSNIRIYKLLTTSGVEDASMIGAMRAFLPHAPGPVPVDANFVETTIALAGELIYTTTVTGQPWVRSTSKIVCAPFAVANAGTTEEMVMASGVTVGAKNRVSGVGFDVWAYNPNGMTGTLTVHCVGV